MEREVEDTKEERIQTQLIEQIARFLDAVNPDGTLDVERTEIAEIWEDAFEIKALGMQELGEEHELVQALTGFLDAYDPDGSCTAEQSKVEAIWEQAYVAKESVQ